MGRRKISIAPISDDRNRQVTFLKRKNGLFKKAYELGVLCSADVAVVVFNANGKLFEFHSGDMDTILLRYSHYAGPPHEKRGPMDYINKDLLAQTGAGGGVKSKMGGKMTTSGGVGADEDDEDDEGFLEDDLPGEEGMEGEEEGAEGSSGVMTMAQHDRIRQSATVSNGPIASGSGSGSSGNGNSSSGKKVVIEGKGKQAVVAAKAREKRTGSIASDNEPPQPANYPPSLNSYPPNSSSNSTSDNYPPYSLPPPSNPHHQNHPPPLPQHQSQNPYSFLSGFPPPPPPQYQPQYPSQFPQHPSHALQPQHHHLPPPPNPADLFSMGLFGNSIPPPPGMLNPNHHHSHPHSQNNSSSSQQQQNGNSSSSSSSSNPMNQFFGAGGGGFNFGGPQGAGYPNPFTGGGGGFNLPGMNGYPTPSSEGNQGVNSQGGGGVPNWFGSSNPMLAALAQQQQQQYLHSQRQQSQRPASVNSNTTSQSRQSPEQHQRAVPPTRQDSTGSTSTSASKPRLIVSIPPSESNVEEGRKKGLVTAGGASILGKGFEGRSKSGEGEEMKDGGEMREGERENEDEEEDEQSQPTAVPRSAFASDLIAASPFYPPTSSSSSQPPNPYPPSNFNWPQSTSSSQVPPSSSFRPAPMLGESDAPDLIRDSPDPILENSGEGGEEGEVRRLKRPSVDLEDGMEGLEVEGNDGVGGKEEGDSRAGDRRKRRA